MKIRLLLTLSAVVIVSGCASNAQPTNTSNICSIFDEKRGWHRDALKMEKKWGVPVHVPMAMMKQESSFIHNARPPRKYFLGFIPNGRISSALGYSQALDGTWAQYQRSTGNRGASRKDFGDSLDFMGWYINETHRQNKISKWDARAQYLNYHEGWGGYRRKTYNKKAWLVGVSSKVSATAGVYSAQYRSCKDDLPTGWFW